MTWLQMLVRLTILLQALQHTRWRTARVDYHSDWPAAAFWTRMRRLVFIHQLLLLVLVQDSTVAATAIAEIPHLYTVAGRQGLSFTVYD